MAVLENNIALYLVCVMCILWTQCIGRAETRRYRSCDEGCCIHEYCAYNRICYPKIHCRFGCPDGTCVGGKENDEKDLSTANVLGTAFQTNQSPSEPVSAPNKLDSGSDSATSMKERENPGSGSTSAQTTSKTRPASQRNPILGERYFNQDNEITSRAGGAERFSASPEAHNQIVAHALGRQLVPNKDSKGLAGTEQPVSSQSGMYAAAQAVAKDLPGNSGICMPSPPCKEGDYCGMAHVCAFNYNLGYFTCQYNLEIGSTLCYDKYGELNLQPST